MQRPLQITFRGMDTSEAVEQRIRAKAEELEHFSDRITSCHVTVQAPHQHHRKGKLFDVRVVLHVPGREIVAGREHSRDHAHEDVYVAIRDAFKAATRQLEDYARRQRGDVKVHEVPDHGTVAKLFSESGYGFVLMPDGVEVYFHENAVTGQGFRQLKVGSEVRVVVAEGEGREGPQASTVTPIGKHHLVTDETP